MITPKTKNTLIIIACVIVFLGLLFCTYANEIVDFATGLFKEDTDSWKDVWSDIVKSFDDRDVKYEIKIYDGENYEEFETFEEALYWTEDYPYLCKWVFDDTAYMNYILIMSDNNTDMTALFEFENKATAKRYYDYYYQDEIDTAAMGEKNYIYMMLFDNLVVYTSYDITDFEMALIRSGLIKAGYFKNEHDFNQKYIDFMKETNPND